MEKPDIFYIHAFYSKLKNNNLPKIQLHSWTEFKPFFKVQDEINFINNNKIKEVPPEPRESVLDPVDFGPLDIQPSPELVAAALWEQDDLPQGSSAAMTYATYRIMRYMSKWVLDEIGPRIVKLNDYMIGEEVYGRFIFPRDLMHGAGDVIYPAYEAPDIVYPRLKVAFDKGWYFHDRIVDLYFQFNDSNAFSKIWWVFFMMPIVYFLTIKSVPVIKSLYEKAITTPTDDYYMNNIMKPTSTPDNPFKDIDVIKFIGQIMQMIDEEFDIEFYDSCSVPGTIEEDNYLTTKPISFASDVADDYEYPPKPSENTKSEESEESEESELESENNNNYSPKKAALDNELKYPIV